MLSGRTQRRAATGPPFGVCSVCLELLRRLDLPLMISGLSAFIRVMKPFGTLVDPADCNAAVLQVEDRVAAAPNLPSLTDFAVR